MSPKRITELPDPFRFESGGRVQTEGDWRKRRRELADAIVEIEYGGLPPTPSGITAQRLFTHQVKRFGGASFTQYRLVNNDAPSSHFCLDVLAPAGEGPFPVVLTGDGCFRYMRRAAPGKEKDGVNLCQIPS